MKIDKNTLIVGVLVLLIVISVVQAVQLGSIKGKMNDLGATSVVKSTSPSSSSGTQPSSTSSVPTNLQNLPGMVGGC